MPEPRESGDTRARWLVIADDPQRIVLADCDSEAAAQEIVDAQATFGRTATVIVSPFFPPQPVADPWGDE